MDIKNIIRRIATENGVTPEEVEKEMMNAIRIGMSSTDPNVQAHWKRMSPSGTEPTINEVLTYLVSETVKR
jgi:hypothetical protein